MEPECTRLTAGGDRINYSGDVSMDTANLTMAKLLINSTISTPGAWYACFDLKDYYLGMLLLGCSEFMQLPLNNIPTKIVEEYQLLGMVHNDYVYLCIDRGMYGLPHAGLTAQQQLIKPLAPHRYAPSRHKRGLWKHET